MRRPYTQLYVHLVWSTRDRLPLITDDVRAMAYRCFRSECRALHADLVAVGGTEDHVHLLVRLPTSVSIARVVQQMKGASSHLIAMQTGDTFRWQGGYGAFTVSTSVVPRVRQYIGNQELHHREGTFFTSVEPPGDRCTSPTSRPQE